MASTNFELRVRLGKVESRVEETQRSYKVTDANMAEISAIVDELVELRR